MPEYTVPPDLNGARIDKFFAAMMGDAVSRSQIQKAIKSGLAIDADGATVAENNRKVAEGENYSITLATPRESPARPEDIPLDILYEDDDVIVVNKPAGMVVHAGAGVSDGTLVNALLHHTSLSSIGAAAGRSGIVHRLDKDTSGAMLACKTDRAHIAMYRQFETHSVRREYAAIVWGILNPASGTIDKNLARNPRNYQEFVAVPEGGKTAVTHYETTKVFSGAKFKPMSLIKCSLETGRTHQIRVHMASAGHPILGDSAYGSQGRLLRTVESREAVAILKSAARQMLHSRNISFRHPTSGKDMRFEAPIPPDMQAVMDGLKALNT
ncbi:MAG: RluA family pseudouridine synthase [Rickettsiales bacterium]|jgi:23S rRNA pseudouridine1911/1915/1917 synthase|nr:RluA family pseudouridine synthase [Rickettsiales bacterium]